MASGRLSGLAPASRADAEAAATWVSSAEDVLVFAGPRLAFPVDPDALLEPGPEGWVAYALRADGVRVGLGSVRRFDEVTARIGRVLVDPSRRGEGFGRALMEGLVAEASGLGGIEQVTLGVWTSNAGARALYRSLGFTNTGIRHTAVGAEVWESVEMALRLTRSQARTTEARDPVE